MRLRRPGWRATFLGLAVWLAVAGGASAAEPCPPMEQTILSIAANEARARADVTDDLRCHFPAGMTFNDAAKLLERNKFDMLNGTEPSFFLWNINGEEFIAKRFVSGAWSNAEFRVIIHTEDRKLTRFAAQYFSIEK